MNNKDKLNVALNNRVSIIFKDESKYRGWLVKDKRENYYCLLPMNDYEMEIITFRVSHIKHIKYLLNNYQLW